MKTKAILVAGGKGSRLYPFTRYTQKTLLPLYKRPVIDYALGTIRRGGIRQITIISNEHIGHIAKHVGQSMEGEQIHYVLEEEPQGVAQALLLARPHNEDCRLMIYFSDNITTVEFEDIVQEFEQAKQPPGCLLLAREEANPQAFGVAVLDDEGEIIDVVEKPENPPSNLAIGGIYLFDETFWDKLDDAFQEKENAFSNTFLVTINCKSTSSNKINCSLCLVRFHHCQIQNHSFPLSQSLYCFGHFIKTSWFH